MRDPIRDKGRLQHILEAIERVQEYTRDVQSMGELDNDPMRKHATIYNVQIIGEAIYKLSIEFKDAHPDTPWRMIEKSRHILVHDYYQVDMSILWNIITEDMVPLKNQIKKYIEEL